MLLGPSSTASSARPMSVSMSVRRRTAVLPASEQHTNPLVRQSSNRRMMGFAGGDLGVIEDASPLGAGDRTPGKLVKRLPQERGTGPANMYPPTVSAACGDGRNSRVSLQLSGVGVTVALGSERRNQPRLKCRTRSRQLRK